MFTDGCIDTEREAEIHGGVGNGTQNGGWAGDSPCDGLGVGFGAEIGENILLVIVEVGLKENARIRLLLRVGCRAKVDAVVNIR